MNEPKKPENLYLVESPSGRNLHIWAVSSNQAKRSYCREFGIKANDYWCGVRSLSARKLKPEEVKAWEEEAPARLSTYLFIRGMMEIGAKARTARGAAEGVTT